MSNIQRLPNPYGQPPIGKKPIDNNKNTTPNTGQAQFAQQLIAAGIPSEVVQQGSQAIAAYAQANNIQLPPPPQGIEAGQDTQQQGAGNDNEREQFAQKLIAAGIPETTVRQGPQAVEAYITVNNIDRSTLPSPPQGNRNTTIRGIGQVNLNQSNVLPAGSGGLLNFNA
jgi:hypothetical protein